MSELLLGIFILLMFWSCSDECAHKSMSKCVGIKVKEMNQELKEGLEETEKLTPKSGKE